MLAVDYAWTHPDPGAIKRAGYSGALRYLSNDKTKNITASEVVALHRAGLWVGLVWETTAQRASQGAKAGQADRRQAEKMAKALGYPAECVIFYAVDFDANPGAVKPYFQGVTHGAAFHSGVYGGIRVVDALITSGVVAYGWQTVAWSGGALSSHAHVYQRQRPTKAIVGARGGYDEDVILKPFPVWSPKVTVAPKPVPAPSAPHPLNPDHDLVTAFQEWMSQKGLTG